VSISEPAGSIVFQLDAALTETRRAVLLCQDLFRFFNTESIEWQAKKLLGFVDSTGDLAYGNIDRFVRDEGAYSLSGDWVRS
jgi:hypothetical protein